MTVQPSSRTSTLPAVSNPLKSLQATSFAIPSLECVAICDTGAMRKDNQDAYRIQTERIGPGREVLSAVADGMGGLMQGRFASNLALQVFFEAFERNRDSVPAKALRRAMEEANQAIQQAGLRLRFPQIGTTLTAVCLEGRWITLAHIGDSRAYLLRDGTARCLTTDHSRASELAKMRLISPDAIRTHEQRSVLTRALGLSLIAQPEISQTDVRNGDVLLLCSDGLWSVLSDEELADLLRNSGSLMEFTRRIVEHAMECGSDDNVCAVSMKIGERGLETAAPRPASLWRRLSRSRA